VVSVEIGVGGESRCQHVVTSRKWSVRRGFAMYAARTFTAAGEAPGGGRYLTGAA